MLKFVDTNSGSISDMHWKSLRYFSLYRLCIAGLLFGSALLHPASFSILDPDRDSFHLVLTSFYLLATTLSFVVLHYFRERFNWQLSASVLVDVLVLTLLMHTGGGLRSGLRSEEHT